MNDRLTSKQIIGYLGFFLVMAAAAYSSMGLDAEATKLIMKEGGVVETASAVGYGACILLLWYMGRSGSLASHWYLYLMFLAMALRELDFDKRFTETGVLKSKFLVADDVGLTAKIFGASVLVVLIVSVVVWARRHLRGFVKDVLGLRSASWAAGFALVFIVATKSIDGLARKLEPLGIEISSQVDEIASRFEEVFELGIPITFLYAIYLYWRSFEAPDS